MLKYLKLIIFQNDHFCCCFFIGCLCDDDDVVVVFKCHSARIRVCKCFFISNFSSDRVHRVMFDYFDLAPRMKKKNLRSATKFTDENCDGSHTHTNTTHKMRALRVLRSEHQWSWLWNKNHHNHNSEITFWMSQNWNHNRGKCIYINMKIKWNQIK